METIIPRYEFRTFAQNFGPVEEKLRKLSPCQNIRESSEIYLLSASNDANNIKIRYNTLDIKMLVRKEQGLEQWRPQLKTEFPIQASLIREKIFPALTVGLPPLQQSAYTLSEFLEELIDPQRALLTAHVFKRRFSFTVNKCIAELAELLVNGAAIQTVAVESEDITAVLQAKEMLGLLEYENVNYLLAIKRIMGLKPLPP